MVSAWTPSRAMRSWAPWRICWRRRRLLAVRRSCTGAGYCTCANFARMGQALQGRKRPFPAVPAGCTMGTWTRPRTADRATEPPARPVRVRRGRAAQVPGSCWPRRCSARWSSPSCSPRGGTGWPRPTTPSSWWSRSWPWRLPATGGPRRCPPSSAALAFDFFLTRPYGSFRITRTSDLVTELLLLVVGLTVGDLAARGRTQRVAAVRGRANLELLHSVTELAASGGEPGEVVQRASRELTDCSGCGRACSPGPGPRWRPGWTLTGRCGSAPWSGRPTTWGCPTGASSWRSVPAGRCSGTSSSPRCPGCGSPRAPGGRRGPGRPGRCRPRPHATPTPSPDGTGSRRPRGRRGRRRSRPVLRSSDARTPAMLPKRRAPYGGPTKRTRPCRPTGGIGGRPSALGTAPVDDTGVGTERSE